MRGSPQKQDLSTPRTPMSPRIQQFKMKRTLSINKVEAPTFEELYEKGKPLSFGVVFVDLQKSVCNALTASFPTQALFDGEVNIRQGNFQKFIVDKIDCIAVNSNSFGLLDRGFERAVCELLGDTVKDNIQRRIIAEYNGEQPIGTCFIERTNHESVPFIAHSPTRRINYSIRATDNAYLSMTALLREVSHWNSRYPDHRIRKVLMTGLGTFYGALRPEESARQTVLAWLIARMPTPVPSELDWTNASIRQKLVGFGGFPHFIDEVLNNSDTALTEAEQKLLIRKIGIDVINKEVMRRGNSGHSSGGGTANPKNIDNRSKNIPTISNISIPSDSGNRNEVGTGRDTGGGGGSGSGATVNVDTKLIKIANSGGDDDAHNPPMTVPGRSSRSECVVM